jgi:hypothetical protein
VNADLPSTRNQQKNEDWNDRQRSRERLKLIGLLAVALILLAMAFLRFGKTIPWGAR